MNPSCQSAWKCGSLRDLLGSAFPPTKTLSNNIDYKVTRRPLWRNGARSGFRYKDSIKSAEKMVIWVKVPTRSKVDLRKKWGKFTHSRRVNQALGKGYTARRAGPVWLLLSFKGVQIKNMILKGLPLAGI